ncbi:MAG: GPW/gp25 family protein [Chloroflexota bacterium]|nr:GPW/gp25 family protein [Chloroflexota bacterium]
MQISYPLRFDNRGRTATVRTSEQHIHEMIEQLLFTSPGERVNRPDFGCGVRRLIFVPNSDAEAAAAQFLIQGALQQQMGDVIDVEAVDVSSSDSSLIIQIQYTIRLTQESKVTQFIQQGV